jgi:hypothetical protein
MGVKFMTGLMVGLLCCVSAFGQTADECIKPYEDLKPEFEKLSAAGAADRAQEGRIISLDREGDDQDLPAGHVRAR